MNDNKYKKIAEQYGSIIFFIIILICIVLWKYVKGDFFLLSHGVVSDTLRANLPTYIQMYDGLFVDHNFWSWKMGIGTSMFTHADVYFDPFVYILFIKGRDGIAAMLVWMMVAKLCAEGCAMGTYLHTLGVKTEAVIISSVMYAFSGYSIIMGYNFALGTILVYVPLAFWGVERWLAQEKKGILLISLCLIAMYSYYFLFSFGLLLAGYVLIRTKQLGIQVIPKLFTLCILGLLSIGLTLFSILPQLELVLASDRVAGTKDVKMGIELFLPQVRVLATSFLRMLSNDICGNRVSSEYWGYTYNWNIDYFQNSVYISSIAIILLGQLVTGDKRRKKTTFKIILLFSVVILFPIFSYIFNAFATINARWMFIISFAQTVAIALGIDTIIKRGRVLIKPLLCSVFITYILTVVALTVISLDNSGKIVISDNRISHVLWKILYLSIIWFGFILIAAAQKRMKSYVIRKSVFIIGIVVIVLVDTFANYNMWFSTKYAVNSKDMECGKYYGDRSSEVIADIMQNDTCLFRLTKNFDSVYDDDGIPSDNDALVQRYYGLKSYNSVNNSNYSAFLKELGVYVANPLSINDLVMNKVDPKEIVGNTLNYINGVYDRYMLMSYLGVKYYLINNDEELPSSFEMLQDENGLKLYLNKNYLPIAFINESSIGIEQFEKLREEEKEIVLFQYTVTDETKNSLIKTSERDVKEIALEKQKAFKLQSFRQDELKFSIDAYTNGYLNLSIPYDKNWHIYIDGQEVMTQKVNIGLLGCEISSGYHDVTVKYIPKTFWIGIFVAGLLFVVLIIYPKKNNFIVTKIEKIVTYVYTWIQNSTREIIKYCIKIRALGSMAYGIVALLISGACICSISRLLGPAITYLNNLQIKRVLCLIFFCVLCVLLFLWRDYFYPQKDIYESNNINIDIIRVVSMLLIIAYDCINYSGATLNEDAILINVATALFLALGKIAYVAFFLTSSWLLIDTKCDLRYFVYRWLQTCIYYVILMFIVLLNENHSFALYSIDGIMPINGTNNLYLSAYLIFYLFVPYIGSILKDLNKRQARILLLILLDLVVWQGRKEQIIDYILLFVFYYVVIFNIKTWPLRFIKKNMLIAVSVLSVWGLITVSCLFAINPENQIIAVLNNYLKESESIISLIGGISFVILGMECKTHNIPIIHICSMSSFGVFLLVHNKLVENILWNKIVYISKWIGSIRFPMMVIAMTLMVYVVGVLIDKFYEKIVRKPVFNLKRNSTILNNIK